jgi:hypothetical protein
MPWVGYPLSRGERCQSANTKVDPDLFARFWKLHLCWFIQAKTHEVSPTTVLGYRNCTWRTRELTTPFDVQTTDLGNAEVLVSSVPIERSDGVRGTLFSMLGMKPRIFCPLGKEISKRRLQVSQCLLLRNARRFSQKRERRIISMFCPCLTAGVVIHRLSVLKTVCAKSQCEVVGVTNTPELFGKLPLLATSGIDSECISNFHLQDYCASCKKSQAALKGGVFTQEF